MKAIHFRTPEKWLFTLGAGLIVAAAIGGGLEVAGFEIPLVSSVPRQLVLGLFGIVVTALSFLIPGERKELPPASVGIEDEAPVQKARTKKLVTAMPSETVVDRGTEVWVQICRATSSGFVETLPRYTASGEEIRKVDARSHPATVHFPVDNERLESTALQVSISAPDFLVEEKEQRVILSPSHDSGLIVFALTPHTPARMSRVLVSVSQQQHDQTVVVGSASLSTRIGTLESKRSESWTVAEERFDAKAIPAGSEEEGVPVGFGILTGKRTESDPADPLRIGHRGDATDDVQEELRHGAQFPPLRRPAEGPTWEESQEETASAPVEPLEPDPAVVPAPRSTPPDAFRRGRARSAYFLLALAVGVGGALLIAWKVLV
ncbi:MAG: hypothetical protein ACRDJT_05080 [Actinomycetota bacterium]